MVAKKGPKGGMAADDGEEERSRVPLQAILLADSFATLFRPITLERPKVLLPLVNARMIDYTLAWLESSGVEEVYVFCCAHSKQVSEYLERSKWFGRSNFLVTTIASNYATSAGEALRVIYERGVICGDFVLVSGDTVSNMPLTQMLAEHKERRKRDSYAVMTMAIQRSKSSNVTHKSRLGTDELFIAVNPETKQLLYYEDKGDNLKGSFSLDNALLTANSSICIHNDKQDCFIDICSPEVLSHYIENVDYQHLRAHFVKGLLDDDGISGYKVFVHDIRSSYAARIDNLRSYDTVSKDIIQRWTYPFVPDTQLAAKSVLKHGRQGNYRASGSKISPSATIGSCTVIGNGSTIGNFSNVTTTVIGEGCVIGSNVSIEGCYIWDRVTIEDGCKLKHAVLCDGVILRSGAILEPGVVLSFNVIVGQNFRLPSYSKVSLFKQPIKQDSDEELEYVDDGYGTVEISSSPNSPERMEVLRADNSDVGDAGAGCIWSVDTFNLEEEWLQSIAPVLEDQLTEIVKNRNNQTVKPNEDDTILQQSLNLELGSSDNSDEDIADDSLHFQNEVEATFLRGVHENVKEDNLIFEINALKAMHNCELIDCASALFYAMMKLALETPHTSSSELVKNVAEMITKWKKLLKCYLKTIDEEIEIILKFEEMCLEFATEYIPIFPQILHIMYEKDMLQEDAILKWASEKEEADESDKVLLKHSEKLIQWLREASEEDE